MGEMLLVVLTAFKRRYELRDALAALKKTGAAAAVFVDYNPDRLIASRVELELKGFNGSVVLRPGRLGKSLNRKRAVRDGFAMSEAENILLIDDDQALTVGDYNAASRGEQPGIGVLISREQWQELWKIKEWDDIVESLTDNGGTDARPVSEQASTAVDDQDDTVLDQESTEGDATDPSED